jgi:hypothetical protein
MDKTIMIDGKPVVFRKTAGTARRYQMQFQREFLDDLQKLADMQAQLAPDAPKETKARAVMGMETAWMYDIAFIMAQQADPSIRDELEWLDRFESIDIYAVIGELIPMLVAEGRPSPKNA